MDYAKTIVNELGQTLSSISERNTENLIDMIEGADRVFLAGCGRSGLMVRGFAMRLMHMGKKVFVVGETTTPSINQQDLLIIASGSGETGSLVAMANKCKKICASLATVTIFPQATIGKLANCVVIIDAPTAKSQQKTAITSIQPMGSLFEQSLLLYFDSIILRLMERENLTSEVMFRLHANLE